MKKTVTMTFETEELCQEFFAWLCDGGGEQQFFDSCEDHSIEVSSIDYWGGKEEGEFLENGKVEVYGKST